MTLTDFLLARIADDEAAIPSGPPAPWRHATHPAYVGDDSWSMSEHHVRYVREDYECRVADVWHEDVAHHIARHDPARVLAECEAKRRIVNRCEELRSDAPDDAPEKWEMSQWAELATIEEVAAILALPYADHPDYQPEWKP